MNTVHNFTRVLPSVQSSAEIASWLDALIESQYNPALIKKRKKLDNKIAKFVASLTAPGNEEMAYEFNNLAYNELTAIIRACFISGLAYGLTPYPAGCIEHHIEEAVAVIENANYKQWMVIEARLRQQGNHIYGAYNKLDLQFARHKGFEQEAAFLHGVSVAKSITCAVSHQEEI